MIGRWFVGFVVFVGYLCLGAFVFYRIERKEEEKRHYLEMLERLELKDLLAKHYAQVNAHVRKQFIQQLNVYCNRTVLDEGPDEEVVHQYQWTYYNAFFFALTTLSTIGYGNLHPTSCTGRILVLVYSLIGIPLNGIVLTQLGSFFESRILRAHYSYKTQRMMGPQLSLIVDIITYLVPGIIVFILIPSGIIAYFERWTFDESVYFAFVTLTTIGYGDYVAGQTVNTDVWYNGYKIFLVFWIMFGLGYLFMILSFISRAMRSKTLEHIFLERVKHTHSKIWHQFTKDVVYIRRVLNESYLMKFKPVYKKETLSASGQPLRRSQSAPALSEWPVMRKTGPQPPRPPPDAAALADDGDDEEDEESVRLRFEKHRMKRRRALSQNRMRSLLRRTKATSEIDLAHIDKEATFGADIASYEILSRVVDALETAVPNQPPAAAAAHQQQQTAVRGLNDSDNLKKKKAFSFSEGGGQGFSSEDVFANEKNEWTVGGDMLNRENPFIGKHGKSYFEYDTWGGADVQNFKKLNEYTKNGVTGHRRPQQKSRVPKLRRMSAAAFNFLSNNIAPKWLTDRLSDIAGHGAGAAGGGGGHDQRTDDAKHRLSLNADGGYYGYGSTCNGNHSCCSIGHGYNNPRPAGYDIMPSQPHELYNNNNNNNNSRRNRPIPMYAAGRELQQAASSAPEQPRHRRLSSPDPVLAHCANTIAVADFLMTLQRSLDKSSAAMTMQPAAATSSFYSFRRPSAAATCNDHRRHHERRSPLFTLFQDRRPSSSAESWQYSSLTSTVSSSTAATAVAVAAADGRHEQPPLPMQLLIPVQADTGNDEVRRERPDGETEAAPAKKPKKKRVRRFSIRPTTVLAGSTNCASRDVRLDIED